ncbi:hypothetical protein AmDm5_0418 [Acetobacter malorum]|nr:hypothetical protein AmDm5_0418 [Acetobacter malorum]
MQAVWSLSGANTVKVGLKKSMPEKYSEQETMRLQKWQ